MSNILTMGLLVFFVCTLINVILQTLRSIMTITASKFMASLISAIAWGFTALITKQLMEIDITIAVVVTVIGNLIGTWFGMWILEKFKKDKTWVITTNIYFTEDIIALKSKLMGNGLDFTTNKGIGLGTLPVITFTIYSMNQKQSLLIKKILEDTETPYRYAVQEVMSSL